MTSLPDKSKDESKREQFGSNLVERNEKIARTLAERAGINLDAYEDIDINEIGHHLVSGGQWPILRPLAHNDYDNNVSDITRNVLNRFSSDESLP